MRSNSSEKVIILMYFKGEPVEHIYARFPSVFVSFHLLNSERRMPDVIDKETYLIIEFFLYSFRKPMIILLKGLGAEDPHFLRSAIKSSMESNDLVFPVAISLSASASASSQLNSLKYGERDNAYLINSATASSVFGLFANFLYCSISSKISSGIFIVNSRFAIFMFLLRQNTIPVAFESIYTKNCFKRDKTSLFIHPHARYLLEMFIQGENLKVMFDGEDCNEDVR